MKAMILKKICDLGVEKNPLELVDIPVPLPQEKEILVKISCCGVCHTELDEIEGRTPPPHFPIILGHQVVGYVEKNGPGAAKFKTGDRVGIAWIFSSCGSCKYCRSGQENLCSDYKATGRDAHGGYAEFMTVPQDSAFLIPAAFASVEAAPLLCAGAIGYRSLRLAGVNENRDKTGDSPLTLGLTGFGASAHLVLKMIRHQYPGIAVYVFARSPKERSFALELGAIWAGDSTDRSPLKLDCIIDTTPVWKPVVEAMANLAPAGRLVINAIRKEEIDKEELLKLDYPAHLWMEKEIKSVANVARSDVSEFLQLAAAIPLRPEVQEYPLAEANRALLEIKNKEIRGAKVLLID